MTIFEAYTKTKKELESFGVEDYVFEAKQIIRHITGYSNTEILSKPYEKLSEFQQNNLIAIIKQRSIRYPLQYIIGEWGFYGGNFKVGPGVLVPRADTETLIDIALEFLKGKEKVKILDLCTGSGCIAVTLAREKSKSEVTAVEKYEEALFYARQNAALNNTENVNFIKGDIFESAGADEKYDLIVSNPPYIPKCEMGEINKEATFEPETALLGGEDGLDFYKAIINNYKNSLKSGGMLAFEVGINEAEKVKHLMDKAGFKNIATRRDLADIERVVFGTVD